MENYLLLAVSLTAGISKNLISKVAGRGGTRLGDLSLVNLVTGVAGVAVFAACASYAVGENPVLFFLLALLYGAAAIGSQTSIMIATGEGNVSVCSLIYGVNFLIPTFFSSVFFDEGFGPLRLVGLALILASMYLTVSGKKGTVRVKSIVFSFLAMLFAGLSGVIQKIYAYRCTGANRNTFLLCSFVLMLVLSAVLFLVAERTPSLRRVRPVKPMLLPAAGMAACVITSNMLNLYLTAVIPGIVFFPVLNGGTVAFSALFSALLFREKLSPRRVAGIVVCVAALVIFAL